MKISAYISCHTKRLQNGSYQNYYTWEGPRNGVGYIDSFAYRDFKFPFPTKIIYEDYPAASVYIVRTDGLCFFTAIYHDAMGKIENYSKLIKYRLILTAMVWGLAYVPHGVIPSWRHIGVKRGN